MELKQAPLIPVINIFTKGVSLNTIRKRLGHKNLQTTLRYAEESDATTDTELRAWQRRHDRGR